MTSSNVSNLLIQVKQVDVSVNTDKINTNNPGLFEKTLKNVADNVPKNVETNTNSTVKQPKNQANEQTKVEKVDDSSPVQKIKQETKAEKEPEKMDEEIVEKVEEVVEEVVDVIKEKLDVTDEDIELAMENLGLTFIDLLNPQSLAQIVNELTGETDSFALIVSDDFKGILETASSASKELFDITGSTFEELKVDYIKATTEEAPIKLEISENEPDLELEPEMEITPDLVEKAKNVSVEEKVTENVISQTAPKTDEKVEVDLSTDDNPTVIPSEDKKVVTEDKGQQTKEEFTSSQEKQTQKSTDVQPEEKTAKAPVFRQDIAGTVTVNQEPQFIPENDVVSLPTGESVKASDIANQLIEQAKIITDAESTTMEMTLNPEGLGKIFIEVSQKGNEITAKIFTENDAVKQALETQMANLKVEMSQNSTKVTSIEVSVGTHEFERNLDENPKDDSRREEQTNEQSKRNRRINMNSLDDLTGLMSDEDILITQMMKDNGGTLDFMA